MPISTYATTAAGNNTGGSLFPEGQFPATVNDGMRQVQADIRNWYEMAEWLDLGFTPSYVSASSFSVVGDKTAFYSINRRVEITDTATLYGSITSSTFATGNTTVTVSLDGGSITASISVAAISILANDKSMPVNINAKFKSGSTAAPSVAVGNATTGLANLATNQLNFVTNALSRGSISSAGDWIIGSENVNGFRIFDIKNLDTNTNSASLFRLITRNVANSADVATNIVKYKSGQLAIENAETDNAANIAFSLGSLSGVNPFFIKADASGTIFITSYGTNSVNGTTAALYTYGGKDSAGNAQEYVTTSAIIKSNVNGSEDASFLVNAMRGSVATPALEVGFDASGNNLLSFFGQMMTGNAGVNGYFTIPLSGGTIPFLRIQFGSQTVAGGASLTFALPMAYGTVHLGGLATSRNVNSGDLDGNAVGYDPISPSQATLQSSDASSRTVYWISWGY